MYIPVGVDLIVTGTGFPNKPPLAAAEGFAAWPNIGCLAGCPNIDDVAGFSALLTVVVAVGLIVTGTGFTNKLSLVAAESFAAWPNTGCLVGCPKIDDVAGFSEVLTVVVTVALVEADDPENVKLTNTKIDLNHNLAIILYKSTNMRKNLNDHLKKIAFSSFFNSALVP